MISRGLLSQLPTGGLTESLLCGGLAGASAKVCVLPLDLAKKRLQVGTDHFFFFHFSRKCVELELVVLLSFLSDESQSHFFLCV